MTPRTVQVTGAGGTALPSYLWRTEGTAPAVVMMHGRQGAYSTAANGSFTAATLSGRHALWGRRLARWGYHALLPDGFGPRGYPQGFPRGSYRNRPAAVSEQTVRPLDALGAAEWLGQQPWVACDAAGPRLAALGWSNGAMALLVAAKPGLAPGLTPFRGFVCLYPGCAMRAVAGPYRPEAPLLLLLAEQDEEVEVQPCLDLHARVVNGTGPVTVHSYPGATHSFDSPALDRRAVRANRVASADASRRVAAFLAMNL